ncbi:hypothetical protein HPB51_022877 [Rhipicephalus microplus]|uniref:Orn/DAP/Arg decarboxylase 2 N-terminal domain-containing protein n=1 Tax=Rhipicephalus microplus TaxID=6941 RepID=A0A9J6DR07_RHIMP|nr:hypothetical protein HPB51_022877 [Rhipicephalus microplus]
MAEPNQASFFVHESAVSVTLQLKVVEEQQSSHLDFAESSGVTLMTFDCLEELQKIKDKNARLLLRFSAQAGDHEDRMARKYGCSILEAEHILRVATDQGHTVVGIAFHIGGRHFSTESYRSAIEKARRLFDISAQMGIKMTVLDIGGGFVGSTRRRDLFIQVCETVRSALDEHFPSTGGIHVIAEPGQYMVTSSFTLAVKVVAKRTRQTNVDGISCNVAFTRPSLRLFRSEISEGERNWRQKCCRPVYSDLGAR